jgi:hypothetical protein
MIGYHHLVIHPIQPYHRLGIDAADGIENRLSTRGILYCMVLVSRRIRPQVYLRIIGLVYIPCPQPQAIGRAITHSGRTGLAH